MPPVARQRAIEDGLTFAWARSSWTRIIPSSIFSSHISSSSVLDNSYSRSASVSVVWKKSKRIFVTYPSSRVQFLIVRQGLVVAPSIGLHRQLLFDTALFKYPFNDHFGSFHRRGHLRRRMPIILDLHEHTIQNLHKVRSNVPPPQSNTNTSSRFNSRNDSSKSGLVLRWHKEQQVARDELRYGYPCNTECFSQLLAPLSIHIHRDCDNCLIKLCPK